MEKKGKKILKGAGVLFVAVILMISISAVAANTTFAVKKDTTQPSCLVESYTPTLTVKSPNPTAPGMATLWDNGPPDARNGLSCCLTPTLDRLIVDDFIVGETGWEIDDGHFSVVTNTGGGTELIDDVYVYFFESTGPCEPALVEFALLDPAFTATLTGDTYFSRPEVKIDVVFDPPVVLTTPGEWWVCFQVVSTDNIFWLTAAGAECSVFCDMPDLGYTRWTWGFDVWAEEFDMSFALTGEEITSGDPLICCDPMEMSWYEVEPGSTLTGSFHVWNCGDPDTTLNWEVSEWPQWMEDGGVVFTPPSGSEPEAGPGTQVDFTFTAPADPNTSFQGTVVVKNVDNPDDVCEMTTDLETPLNSQSMNLMQTIMNILMQRFA